MTLQGNETQSTVLWALATFMEQELSAMAANVVSNYANNVANRENNPFLAFSDASIKKYMALARSVDSQLGNRLQRIIFYIARIKYGDIHVPNIVAIDISDESERSVVCTLYSVPFDLPVSERNKDFDPYKQVVYVEKNRTDREIKRDLKIKAQSGNLRKLSFRFEQISADAFQNIRSRGDKRIPVDLLYFDCSDDVLNNANAFEIKMGGNLDTKNAKSNAQEVKELAQLFSFLGANYSYFATCYGTCSASVDSKVKEIMGDGAILNGPDFWGKIIPSAGGTFTYDDFIRYFREAFLLSHLEDRLKSL